MRLGELGEHVYRVVADGKDRDLVAREVGQGALQLHELRLAEGSPTSTTVKKHDRTTPGAGLMQIRAGIPAELVDVLQAVILLFLVMSPVLRRVLGLRASRGETAGMTLNPDLQTETAI